MPRHGPRPYECVKRAWHSERLIPMRGSIIQKIFRLVKEAHSSATRNNKEWQEKLPVVVLKVEEIIYSKANSEEEYANPETLWTRVNDAIDTIIPRDESTETGQLLPPCVEAALNLGCVPEKASRSQRHSNSRTYLSPRVHEMASAPSRTLHKTTNGPCLHLPSYSSGKFNSASKPATSMAESDYHASENNDTLIAPRGYSFLHENTQREYNQLVRTEANNHTEQFPLGSRVSEHTKATPIIVGKPIGISILDRGEMGGFQNLF